MVRFAAQVISFLFHPLLLSTYLVILLGAFFPAMVMADRGKVWIVTAFVFVFTFLLPALNLIMLRSFKTIGSLTLRERQERIFPFAIITVIYGIIAFLFYYELPFPNLNKLMLIVFGLVLASFLITFFVKISVHSISMAGAFGIVLPLNKAMEEPRLLVPAVVLIVLAGLVMSARLILGAHTLREVLHGAAVGFAIGYSGVMVLF
jgi:membrane-associated phospholipid phosphatase